VILVAVVPIGMPVVVGAVLAAGAREMAQEKAIVSRCPALAVSLRCIVLGCFVLCC
jgi:magnesium-transporting ATPase (P-type)